jgi:hypothetical protein
MHKSLVCTHASPPGIWARTAASAFGIFVALQLHIQLKERHGEACEQVEGEGALEILHCYRLPIVYDFAPTQDSEVEIDKNVENEEAVEHRVDDQCGHLTGTHSHDQCGQGEGGQGGKSGDRGAGGGGEVGSGHGGNVPDSASRIAVGTEYSSSTAPKPKP